MTVLGKGVASLPPFEVQSSLSLLPRVLSHLPYHFLHPQLSGLQHGGQADISWRHSMEAQAVLREGGVRSLSSGNQIQMENHSWVLFI